MYFRESKKKTKLKAKKVTIFLRNFFFFRDEQKKFLWVRLGALRVRVVYIKRLWGKTNYSNGPQCLSLPCKWCIQRIGTGLCGRLSAHPCPSPQERNRNTHCADRSIEIDEISITYEESALGFYSARIIIVSLTSIVLNIY